MDSSTDMKQVYETSYASLYRTLSSVKEISKRIYSLLESSKEYGIDVHLTTNEAAELLMIIPIAGLSIEKSLADLNNRIERM